MSHSIKSNRRIVPDRVRIIQPYMHLLNISGTKVEWQKSKMKVNFMGNYYV
jgi:hypothetical protein